MKRRWRKTNTFEAKSESGELYLIMEYQEECEVTAAGIGNTKWIPGLKKLVTSTRLDVNYVDSETFEIASTGETVRKV